MLTLDVGEDGVGRVALASVGQDHHEAASDRPVSLRQRKRRVEGGPARHPCRYPLPPRELELGDNRVLFAHCNHLVDDVPIEDLGDEARPQAGQMMGSGGPPGEHRGA